MRTTVWYPVPKVGIMFGLDIPAGATEIRFELKPDGPGLSARVEMDAPRERRTFLCIRTLDPIPPGESLRVIGSVVPSTGRDVLHLVELLPRPESGVEALPAGSTGPRFPDSRATVDSVESGRPWYEVDLDPRAVFGHDAHNILAAIMGYEELAREDSPGEGAVGDREELAAARRKLEDLVRAAVSAGTIAETEASILLGDDFHAAGLLAIGLARAAEPGPQ